MRTSKRDLAAVCAKYSGFTDLLGLLPTQPILLVLNHHRIGNAYACEYDSETFSATGDELDDQIRFLKRRWHLATLEEAVEIAERKIKLKRAVVLITFDDGYLDNYELAFKILSSHGVQGVFFLPTSFIGSNRTTWWDMIAFIIKASGLRAFELNYPSVHHFDIEGQGVQRIIRQALDLYQSSAVTDGERFIAALEEACGQPRPDGRQRCFMNWTEAAEMVRGGMAIGSHTHRHEILAKLSAEEQIEELVTSKQLLETHLKVPVHAVAYPVGLPESFSSVTRAAAEQAQYRVGFSFYGGFNIAGNIERYNIRRVSVFNSTAARFGLQTTLAVVTGKYWL
jgi:peptidoglycan/xylan/chitin deacetylase (PgdA/CDA1 family)